MKNVIIGITGAIIIFILCALAFSVYGIASRGNELEHGLSFVVRNTLEKYYGTTMAKENLSEEIETQLNSWVNSDSDLRVTIKVCDFREGILSVGVTESYYTPLGEQRERTVQKTAIVD